MTYYPSPGGSDERVYRMSAVALRQCQWGFGVAEEGEDIRVHVWPLADALKAVGMGVLIMPCETLLLSGWR